MDGVKLGWYSLMANVSGFEPYVCPLFNNWCQSSPQLAYGGYKWLIQTIGDYVNYF